MLVAVQRYTLRPAGASLLKYVSPAAQIAGSIVPTGNGRVDIACEKSMFFACEDMSILVWPAASAQTKAMARTAVRLACLIQRFIVRSLMMVRAADARVQRWTPALRLYHSSPEFRI